MGLSTGQLTTQHLPEGIWNAVGETGQEAVSLNLVINVAPNLLTFLKHSW